MTKTKINGTNKNKAPDLSVTLKLKQPEKEKKEKSKIPVPEIVLKESGIFRIYEKGYELKENEMINYHQELGKVVVKIRGEK